VRAERIHGGKRRSDRTPLPRDEGVGGGAGGEGLPGALPTLVNDGVNFQSRGPGDEGPLPGDQTPTYTS
jgi:hypothetical protein